MVCKVCYNVIKSYLNGDSRKNENYLARFIPFFKKQVRAKVIYIINITVEVLYYASVSQQCTPYTLCVCVCVRSLVLGNPNFKDPYLVAQLSSLGHDV